MKEIYTLVISKGESNLSIIRVRNPYTIKIKEWEWLIKMLSRGKLKSSILFKESNTKNSKSRIQKKRIQVTVLSI